MSECLWILQNVWQFQIPTSQELCVNHVQLGQDWSILACVRSLLRKSSVWILPLLRCSRTVGRVNASWIGLPGQKHDDISHAEIQLRFCNKSVHSLLLGFCLVWIIHRGNLLSEKFYHSHGIIPLWIFNGNESCYSKNSDRIDFVYSTVAV